jgi:hypothetical protein
MEPNPPWDLTLASKPFYAGSGPLWDQVFKTTSSTTTLIIKNLRYGIITFVQKLEVGVLVTCCSSAYKIFNLSVSVYHISSLWGWFKFLKRIHVMASGEFDWPITKKKRLFWHFPKWIVCSLSLVPRYVGDKSGTWAKVVKRDVLPIEDIKTFFYNIMISQK